VVLTFELSTNHRSQGLHPARRAPWRRHHAQSRVELNGLPHGGNDVGAIPRNREILKFWISLPCRHVVVGVMREREIRRPDRLAQNIKADSEDRMEELRHQRRALAIGQRRRQQPGGRLGQRRAEPLDLLKGLVPSHIDRQVRAGRVRYKRYIGLLFEQSRPIARCHPHARLAPLCPRRDEGDELREPDGHDCEGRHPRNPSVPLRSAGGGHRSRRVGPNQRGVHLKVATLPASSVYCTVAPRDLIWNVCVLSPAFTASTAIEPSGFATATFAMPPYPNAVESTR